MTQSFIRKSDVDLSDQYLRQGYVIVPVENLREFHRIQRLVVSAAGEALGSPDADLEPFLNGIHNAVDSSNLNSLRLEIIRRINNEPWFRASYFSLARSTLESLVGNELAMQLRVNLSIQLPEDDGSLLPVHADVWSGDSPYEVVVWVPLVDCYGTKAMYILPPESDQKLKEEFSEHAGVSSEELFERIKQEIVWIEIKAGEVLIFNQNLPHGNRVNVEAETRWSMNCRFKGVFTPYGDKKLGEFFEPITLKAATRIGMSYRFPSLKDGLEE